MTNIYMYLRCVLALAVVLLASLITAAGQERHSLYTSLEAKQCRVTKQANSPTEDYEARCRGAAGYSLLVTEGDLRQNVTVITPKGTNHSLDLWDVVSGAFSSVGPRAEWRLANENGKLVPVGLIIRYNANEDVESPNKQTSYLAVAKITPTEICVVEKILPGPKANEDARRSADNAATKPCLKKE